MGLSLTKVIKKYRNLTAVNEIDFTIETGEIFGLIGQNGAGKTTTFRMILNLQATTAGEIQWQGQPINKLNRDFIGYLPEERGIFPQMTVEAQLYFFGELHGKRKKDLKPVIDYWLERFNLEDKRQVKAETLSKGNQQKVQLLASFIHQPQFLILDEPFSGLDPVNRELLMTAIIDLRDKGMTILFSSHQMDNVEELCDRLCILKKGEMLFSGALQDLKQQYGKVNLRVRTSLTATELADLTGVVNVTTTKDGYTLRLANESYGPDLFEQIGRGGYIEKFSMDYLSLDELFKLKVGEGNE